MVDVFVSYPVEKGVEIQLQTDRDSDNKFCKLKRFKQIFLLILVK